MTRSPSHLQLQCNLSLRESKANVPWMDVRLKFVTNYLTKKLLARNLLQSLFQAAVIIILGPRKKRPFPLNRGVSTASLQ